MTFGAVPYPAQTWSAAAASDRLPVGVAVPVQVGELPVLLYRKLCGEVSGWLNICAHRSAPLAEVDTPCDRLRCPYHGWVYDLEGTLLRTPYFGSDPGPHHLTPVEVRESNGILWVHPGPATPLAPLLDALQAAGAPQNPGWQVASRERHALEADWSVYVENYLEAYHIPFVHPGLARDVELESYQVHVHEGFVTHEVKPRDGAPAAGFWAWVWPNTMLNVYAGGLNLERVLPRGPGRCEVEYTYLFAPDVSRPQREAALAQSRGVTAEDVAICEAVQRNLATGRAVQGALSPRHEGAITAFRQWLRQGSTRIEAMRG